MSRFFIRLHSTSFGEMRMSDVGSIHSVFRLSRNRVCVTTLQFLVSGWDIPLKFLFEYFAWWVQFHFGHRMLILNVERFILHCQLSCIICWSISYIFFELAAKTKKNTLKRDWCHPVSYRMDIAINLKDDMWVTNHPDARTSPVSMNYCSHLFQQWRQQQAFIFPSRRERAGHASVVPTQVVIYRYNS